VDAATPGAIDLATSASAFATGDTLQVAAGTLASSCSLYLNTTLDFTYTQSMELGDVLAIAIQSNGDALVGGQFTTVTGTSRGGIARINVSGTLDTTYNPNTATAVDVRSIAIQSDGKAIIGGRFTTVSGSTRNRIARINTDGTLDTGYDPDASANVALVALQSDGKAIVVGDFTVISGSAKQYIARINTSGTLDTTYNSSNTVLPNSNTVAIAIQSDGKAIIGGNFTTIEGITRNRIARLSTTAALDATYDPNANSTVSAIAIQSDGKAIIGGSFTTVSGSTRNRIARINTNGTLDTGYNPSVTNSEVYAIAIQSDGKAIIGGSFTTVSGSTRNRIARINTDGTLDVNYDPNASATVYAIGIQSDGKAIIGGSFQNVAGVGPRFRLARINASGSLVALRAPYTIPTVQVPKYAVLTLEKANATSPSSSAEWWVINSNAS
jgi:uncharacterized delta-60 repeat protein